MPASVAGWSPIIRTTWGITAVHAATPVCSMTRLVARLPEWTIERRRSSRSSCSPPNSAQVSGSWSPASSSSNDSPTTTESKSGCTGTERSRSSASAAIATGTFIRLAASTGSSASCSHQDVPSSPPSQTATTSRTNGARDRRRADHPRAVVDHRGLARCDAVRRVEQLDVHVVALDGHHRAVLRPVRAQLDRDPGALEPGRSAPAPARADAGQPVDGQMLARPHGDGAGHRLDVQDEARLAVRGRRAEPQPLALADRERIGPVVPAQLGTVLVEDRALVVGGAVTELVAQPAGVVTVRDEADVMADRLVRDPKATGGRLVADRGLGRAAQREERVAQLLLVEDPQHVG